MIGDLAARVLRAAPGHPVRVGLDGPSAAGKTTLADRLAAALRQRTGRRVLRAELDDFMVLTADPHAAPYDSAENWYAHAWDRAAIRELLLAPLGPGGGRWCRTAPGAPPVRAGDDTILVADGVFLQHPELAGCWDLTLYLDVGPAESRRRAVARDRHWIGSAAEAERRFVHRHRPAERRYLAEVRPRDRADIVLDTRVPDRPRLVRDGSAHRPVGAGGPRAGGPGADRPGPGGTGAGPPGPGVHPIG